MNRPFRLDQGKRARAWRRWKWLFGVYLRPRHVATVDTANGRLSFDSRDRSLGRQLCVSGDFEYDFMQEVVRDLRKLGLLPARNGGRIIDVGGYIGMISISFLREGTFDSALALEPNPDSFALLLRNAEQNGVAAALDARNIAASDESATRVMELSGKNFGDHRIRSRDHREPDHFEESRRRTIEIPAMPLDGLYAAEPELFRDSRLVWMDIQGHEGKFLKGAARFFADHPRLPLMMEFWPYGLRRSGMGRDDFCAIVKSMFTGLYVLGGEPNRRHSGEIDVLYDLYDGPDNGAHLVLVRER